jgi:RNA recognition motif-containing protein
MRVSPYGDYCHVDFKNEQHAAIAVRELNNFVVNSRPLKVDFAKVKNDD